MDRAELASKLGYAARLAERDAGARVIAEDDPVRFQSAFGSAVAEGGAVFLADSRWGPRERAAMADAAQQSAAKGLDHGWLMIPTGGSGGRTRFARHDEQTLWAAVRGFSERFGHPANAVGVLPLHHVSGLMAWLRAALTGAEHRPWDWKRLESGELPPLDRPGDWTISLVPTQLERLLALPAAAGWLARLKAVFVGGGPAWTDLLDRAAAAGLPISTCYGMTETAAMVAALPPADFRAGIRSCGPAMPHAKVSVGEAGLVRVSGESVFRGYWPEFREAREFETADWGEIDRNGHLHLRGRSDFAIITGGLKVDPAQVESALRASGEFADVVVIGLPDPDWGEAIVACHPVSPRGLDQTRLNEALRVLPSHARPKRYAAISPWPRNPQGKIDRRALQAALVSGSR